MAAECHGTYNGTSAVGCFPAGATPEEALYDLVGNVWEWTRSSYRQYPYDPADGREEVDNPTKEKFVLRGGGWYDRSYHLRASFRPHVAPDYHLNNVGCRLARHLP